jgi:hypothetical protein
MVVAFSSVALFVVSLTFTEIEPNMPLGFVPEEALPHHIAIT